MIYILTEILLDYKLMTRIRWYHLKPIAKNNENVRWRFISFYLDHRMYHCDLLFSLQLVDTGL